MPRVLALWVQDWPIVAADIAPDQPGAVLHANRVVASSEAARTMGVVRGLRRREAQSRCPELILAERDLTEEAREFETVAAAIEEFTPRLELTQPGTCVFPTIGPSRYFGGDESLANQILAAANAVLDGRTSCHIGIADGVFAARLATRVRRAGPCIIDPGHTPEFLAPMPIMALDQPDLTTVLWRLGIRTLGDFAELDPRDVLGRFATDGLAAYRRASGLSDRLVDVTDPPEDMAVSLVLEPPLDRIDQAAFAARQVAIELASKLQGRGAACSRVTIEAESEHGERFVRGWRHEGALSVAAMTDRVRWQLDGWLNASPSIRPSGGLSLLVLRPEDLIAAAGRQLGFWGGETEADQRVGRAVARLESLVGADNVQVAVWRGGREPDDQINLLPAGAVELGGRQMTLLDERPWPGRLPAPSPVELFEERQIWISDATGMEVTVSGRGELSSEPAQVCHDGQSWKKVVAWAGPWLLDERWWDPERARRRARFQLVDDDGLAMLVHVQKGSWWLAGIY